MIVHTMTPAEVVAEAITDLPALWNKMKDPIARMQRLSKVDARVRDKEHVVEYRSHGGNNWLVVMRPTKKVLSVVPFLWYWCSDKKIRAARICDEGLSFHFSAHLLDQYFARFNKLEGQLDRFKEFAKENIDLGIESCDAIGEIRCGVRQGYLTGRWEVKDKVVQLTTFVDHGKLFPDQMEQMERLDQQRYEHAHPGRRRTPGYKHPWLKDTRGDAGR